MCSVVNYILESLVASWSGFKEEGFNFRKHATGVCDYP